MARTSMVGVVVAAVVFLGLVPAAGGATAPLALVVPQATAFGVLGHSCGGIQEQAFATGFDATTGYPTGDVHLQTRCGGSGRGGGYHTTTYAAWVGVTWDFTAAIVSSSVLSTAPTNIDPALSVLDANGNQLYNASNSAFLILGPTFVPAPRVTGVSPASGPAGGGTSVTIIGTGFTGATDVSFGATPTTFTVNSDSSITALSPTAPAGMGDVTVTSAGGQSSPTASDQFTFIAAPSVSGLTPDRGPVDGGTTVTIGGADLTDASAVYFGDTPAGFTVNDDASIAAVAPAAEAADSVAVTVITLGGTSAISPADRYTYVVVPAAPTTVRATAGDGSASVRWSAPASNGAPITGYVVTPYIMGTAQTATTFSSVATTETITGLTNGTAYTFEVAAASGALTGPSSLDSPGLIVGAPRPPTAARARSASTVTTTGSLVVSFVAGANNGSAITGYTARCASSNGGVVGVKSGATSPLTVTSLTTAATYTCAVRATNARGMGLPSVPSVLVIVGSPAPPTAVVAAYVGAGQIEVTFTLGADNGSAITSQTATCISTNGGVTKTATHGGATATPIAVVGATVGASYACTVKATNTRGAGLASGPSAAVTA